MTKRKRQAQNSSQGDWKRRLELSGVGDVNSGCRGQVWFSRVSQSHGLHCPSGALSASLQVVRTLEELRKDNPYPSPANEWLLTQSGGGGKEPGIWMDKSSGHPRHSASSYLHFAILVPIRHSQAPNFLPLRTLFLYRLPHSGDLPHSITGPLPHFPIRPP